MSPNETNRRKWSKISPLNLNRHPNRPVSTCRFRLVVSQSWVRSDSRPRSTHYVSDEIEQLRRLSMTQTRDGSATCEAESWVKEIWRCTCGFSGSYVERDKHFVANDGDKSHTPPIKNAPTRVMNGKRLTKPTTTTITGGGFGSWLSL